MRLKNKRILITAGPTWVPIDDVRVISNTATGETGILLAKEAARLRFKVTLVLGLVGDYRLNNSINIIRFKFFNELKEKIIKELRSKRYDVVIHSAAVSDFKPRAQIRGKLNSEKAHSLKLVPLPKIIEDIRRFLSAAKLVIFKLESAIPDTILIQRAKAALIRAGADFVVANRLNPYRAFIINERGNTISARNKKELAKKLLKVINQTL